MKYQRDKVNSAVINLKSTILTHQ